METTILAPMLMYGKVSQEIFVELTACPAIPNSKAEAKTSGQDMYAPGEGGTMTAKEAEKFSVLVD